MGYKNSGLLGYQWVKTLWDFKDASTGKSWVDTEIPSGKRLQFANWKTTIFNRLVGGDLTILKNDGVRQWVSDDIPYMKWKIKNGWNHQPVGNTNVNQLHMCHFQ